MSQQVQTVDDPIDIFRWFTKNGFPPKSAPRYNARSVPLERAMGTHKIQGDRFTGKSALGEAISYMYLKTGASIYDLYAANDQENAAWLYSPWASHVTLLVGSNCTLHFDKLTYKFKRAIDIVPKEQGSQNIFVACKRFFQTEDDYYRAVWSLSDRFKERTNYDRVDVIFIREAQEVLAGILRSHAAHNEKDAAAAFIRFHNQVFHFGYAVILDSQRDVEVAKAVRELADWNYFKNMGGMEIPKKYWHTFRNADPDRVYREMEPWQFILYAKGKTALGRFLMPPWHIDRGSDILHRLGITPEFKGPVTTPLLNLSGGSSLGGPGRPKDELKREKIKELHLQGLSYAGIKKKMVELGWQGVANATITDVINEMKAQGHTCARCQSASQFRPKDEREPTAA